MLVGRMRIKGSKGRERERLDRRVCKAPVRVMMWVVLVQRVQLWWTWKQLWADRRISSYRYCRGKNSLEIGVWQLARKFDVFRIAAER